MPRNSTGTYSLPFPTFTAGTPIKSSEVQADFADIATALTNSIAKDGSTPIQGPIKFANGSISAPSITFAGDPTTGWYLVAEQQVGFVISNSLVYIINPDNSVNWYGNQTINGNGTYTGNVAVTGTGTFGGTLSVGGATSIGGALNVTGNVVSLADGTFVKLNSSDTITANVVIANAPIYSNSALNIIGQTNFTGSALTYFQCRLALSGGNLVLSPRNGNLIFITPQNRVIPSAGVSLAVNTALSGGGPAVAGTYYYIYAYMNGSNIALVADTTAPTIDTTYGHAVKTGDNTRTLVGAAVPATGPAWSDTDGARYVLSYYNRRRRSSLTRFTTDRVGSGVTSEINTEIRNQFISWSDEEVIYYADFQWNNGSGAPGAVGAAMSIDANNTTNSGGVYHYTNIGEDRSGAANFRAQGLTEAATHYVTLVSTNITATFKGGALTSFPPPCKIFVEIMG